MISYKEATDLIKLHFHPPKKVMSIEIENAVGYILAEDVMADINLPPFDNSSMDGYAIKFNDSITKWKIIGEISAGDNNSFDIDDNSTVLIMTGAKIPNGADTIIPIENVEIDDNCISIKSDCRFQRYDYIRKKGEDLQINSIAIKANTMIQPNHIQLLSACGKRKVTVFRPLKIGLITTGNELVDIDILPKNTKIRATNIYTLHTLIKSNSMIPINYGIIKDDYQEIKSEIIQALESDIDILITTGGVSVGKYDYIKDIFDDICINTIFWGTNIKPGKPIAFGVYNSKGRDKYIFGLPGNPLSCFISFYIFIKPALNHYYDIRAENKFVAILDTPISKNNGKLHFVMGKAIFNRQNKMYTVSSAGNQSSGNMSTLSKANCIIIFNEEKNKLNNGEIVECMWI